MDIIKINTVTYQRSDMDSKTQLIKKRTLGSLDLLFGVHTHLCSIILRLMSRIKLIQLLVLDLKTLIQEYKIIMQSRDLQENKTIFLNRICLHQRVKI